MINMTPLRTAIARFRKDETGTASIELVFMVPVLTILLISMVTYFTAFRAQTHAIRATTLLTDMISREVAPVTPEYMVGVDGLLKTLVPSDDNPEFRMTVFTYSEADAAYGVVWSQVTGNFVALDDSTLQNLTHRLPKIRDGQRAILVETRVDYTPITETAGLSEWSFYNLMVAAPRFVPQICFLPEGATIGSKDLDLNHVVDQESNDDNEDSDAEALC